MLADFSDAVNIRYDNYSYKCQLQNNVFQLVSGTSVESLCNEQTSCKECIQVSSLCSWCAKSVRYYCI